MLVYYIIINIYSFFICFFDKRYSIKQKYRIPEDKMLFVCFLGGCFSFYLGMYLFRHKIKKFRFKFLVPAFCLVHILAIYYAYKLT
ncbi:MAG: DUF1294 domain-containing protein [Oscillospiraceae bacterium]